MAKYYQLATYFGLKNVAVETVNYIHRCFTVVAESHNFLELDFNLVKTILSSPELNLTCEVQVLHAANDWVRYNFNKRNKYVKDILSAVRFSSLSELAVEKFLCKTEMSEYFEGVLKSIKINYRKEQCKFYTRRYCSQNSFCVTILGGIDSKSRRAVTNVMQCNGSDFKNLEKITEMPVGRKFFRCVYLKGEIYVLGGSDVDWKAIMSVEKYSHTADNWQFVTDMPCRRESFSLCAFVDSIFVIEGQNGRGDFEHSCFELDTKRVEWREIENMNEGRSHAACCLFEEKIVVCGGVALDANYDVTYALDSVESYDPTTGAWSFMPNTIDLHCGHDLVALKNKLFVIDENSSRCEVFDSFCNKFVPLKPSAKLFKFCLGNLQSAVSIGSKILIYGNNVPMMACYDVEKDEWTEGELEITRYITKFGCLKVPQM